MPRDNGGLLEGALQLRGALREVCRHGHATVLHVGLEHDNQRLLLSDGVAQLQEAIFGAHVVRHGSAIDVERAG
eukprot:scaffold138594_cov28-Tisochrysis_lutea.AAC.3